MWAEYRRITLMKRVVILLPTYNEKDSLERFVYEVFAQEQYAIGWQFEVVVVDSNSPDGTLQLAQKLAGQNPHLHTLTVGRGLGVALIEGHQYVVAHLAPDALAQLDADGQVGADVLPRMLKALDEGYDLAIGSRFVAGGKNQLSFLRRIFSWGSCFVCRQVMGPADIGEFTNSARAFTPALFAKINLDRLPWRENTYIIQPAFLHEAVLAGARYKEVPLIFKNREEGYSKNKIIHYIYDVLTYTLDARLQQWGFTIPFFALSRRIKTFTKFGIVGLVGTCIDFAFYVMFVEIARFPPATAKAFSAEIAIVNNFTLNNIWTFNKRKVPYPLWRKFVTFNFISFGGLAIGVVIVKVLTIYFGSENYRFYFLVTIPPVMFWNFFMNHYVTWKRQEA